MATVDPLTLHWQTPTSGTVLNTSPHTLYRVRLATSADARVRARRDWYSDRATLAPNQGITFSQLDKRNGGLRIRYQLIRHPKAPWIQHELNLSTPPQPTTPEPDPWSLGARTATNRQHNTTT